MPDRTKTLDELTLENTRCRWEISRLRTRLLELEEHVFQLCQPPAQTQAEPMAPPPVPRCAEQLCRENENLSNRICQYYRVIGRIENQLIELADVLSEV